MFPHDELQPLMMPLYIGMKVVLTRNVCKTTDFVNGMVCRVEDYDKINDGLRMITCTGKRIVTYFRTDKELGGRGYPPVRLGYCGTIIKYQGAELKHFTLYLDVKGIPGGCIYCTFASCLCGPVSDRVQR